MGITNFSPADPKSPICILLVSLECSFRFWILKSECKYRQVNAPVYSKLARVTFSAGTVVATYSVTNVEKEANQCVVRELSSLQKSPRRVGRSRRQFVYIHCKQQYKGIQILAHLVSRLFSCMLTSLLLILA